MSQQRSRAIAAIPRPRMRTGYSYISVRSVELLIRTTSAATWVVIEYPHAGKVTLNELDSGLKARDVGLGSEPDVQQTSAGCPLIAKTGQNRTFRSGLRYMEAPAVSALPSIGARSNLKSGIVRGGRSPSLGKLLPPSRGVSDQSNDET